MFWRMLAEDGRVWIFGAALLVVIAIYAVRFVIRRQDEEHARRMSLGMTGAMGDYAPKTEPPAETEPPPRADLRRPGPYAWAAPPEVPARPTWTRDEPSVKLDPDGFALEQVSSMHYRGTGIEPHRHPASDHPTFGHVVRSTVCGRCGSHRVLVIDLSWSVHPASGDAHWDIETRCTECGAFNRHADQE